MTSTTDMVRGVAVEQADEMATWIAKAEDCCKAILTGRVFQNGVRGAAIQLKAKLDDAQSLVQKLRKAIHDDFGSPEGGE